MILDIFNKIYSAANFSTILASSVIVLILLFLIILFLGLKDSHKILQKVTIFKNINDFNIDLPKENEEINEDVTFEMSLLTKNLEEYKNNIEKEISNDEITCEVKPEVKDESLFTNTKPFKILDINEIEDTAVLPTFITESTESDVAFTTEEQEEMLDVVLPKKID